MIFWIALFIVLGCILLGLRLGGVGFAYSSGLGLIILTVFLGLTPGVLPISVILIITGVISVIAALELSGGLDYMVRVSEKILRNNPKQINFLAPSVMFVMTFLAGTGHTSYTLYPVIIEVSKEQGIRPIRPLSTTVIAAQIAIVACPVSAAMVAMLGLLEPFNISLAILLAIMLPSTFVALMIAATVQRFLLPNNLETDEGYIKAVEQGLVKKSVEAQTKKELPKTAALSVLIFLITMMIIILYTSGVLEKPTMPNGKGMSTPHLIVMFMFGAGLVIALLSKLKLSQIPNQSTFKAGMTAVMCILGIAWLSNTFIGNYTNEFKSFAGGFLGEYPWLFTIMVACAAAILYSQAATTLLMIPLGIAMGLSPVVLIGSFAAAAVLYFLPISPYIIATLQMDYTGTTRLGKYVFNHPFMIPGLITTIFSCIFAYILSGIIL